MCSRGLLVVLIALAPIGCGGGDSGGTEFGDPVATSEATQEAPQGSDACYLQSHGSRCGLYDACKALGYTTNGCGALAGGVPNGTCTMELPDCLVRDEGESACRTLARRCAGLATPEDEAAFGECMEAAWDLYPSTDVNGDPQEAPPSYPWDAIWEECALGLGAELTDLCLAKLEGHC